MSTESKDSATDAVVEAVRSWAGQQLADRAWPAQVDIDQLIDDDPPLRAVAATLACAKAVVDEVIASSLDLDVMVAVPLDYSDELSTIAPSVTDLVGMRWTYGPGREVPGLCIVSAAMIDTYTAMEEYRIPLDDPAVPEGFVAWYRCGRTQEEARQGWEFARTIYFRWRCTGA